MNALGLSGRTSIATRPDPLQMIRTHRYAAPVQLATAERIHGYLTEAEQARLLQEHGVTSTGMGEAFAALRRSLGRGLIGAGRRLAGQPALGRPSAGLPTAR